MKYTSDTYNPTANQRTKLRKLANYLLSLPEDYEKFDMGSFLVKDGIACWYVDEIDKTTLHTCGTSACALGHAPSIFRVPKDCVDWGDLAEHLFGLGGDEWDWCFDGGWVDVDNTHTGAAKRILWLLDKGLPEYWKEQMYEEENLCYN
jgi:hypothetical protein